MEFYGSKNVKTATASAVVKCLQLNFLQGSDGDPYKR